MTERSQCCQNVAFSAKSCPHGINADCLLYSHQGHEPGNLGWEKVHLYSPSAWVRLRAI